MKLTKPTTTIESIRTISATKVPKRLYASWKKPQAIGVISPSYGIEKISYGLKPDGYSFHKVLRIPLQKLERQGTFWAFTPLLLDYAVELVHSFNELPWGLRPFVVSFESELPRYFGKVKPWQHRAGLALLQSTRCRKILALSEIAADSLRRDLVSHGASNAASKICVFRGMVGTTPMLPDKLESHRSDGPLRVLFVGREAIGKGLPPLLDALDDCRALRLPIEATVVCNFEVRSRISKMPGEEVAKHLARMRPENGITHHYLLPNAEIHKLMLSHDILVFPTLDESLGWVAVEAGLAGMPVIATDIFAIPELVVHGKTGFLIPLKKNERSRWVGLWLEGGSFESELQDAFASIRQHLVRYLCEFTQNRSLVDSMGSAGKSHLEGLYSVDAAKVRLAEIYREAMV